MKKLDIIDFIAWGAILFVLLALVSACTDPVPAPNSPSTIAAPAAVPTSGQRMESDLVLRCGPIVWVGTVGVQPLIYVGPKTTECEKLAETVLNKRKLDAKQD